MALKSGFFDAESFNEETIEGETVLVPDRAYSPEDFNSFFDGIISSTGVFYQTGDIVDGKKQPPFLCEAIPENDFIENVDPVDKFKIKIKTGTGRILGHYIRITGEEYVYVDHGSADGNRWDWIILRLNNPARTLAPAVAKGKVVDTTITDPVSSLPTLNQDTSTSNPDIYEIPIAYIYVPRNASSSTDIRITPQTGLKACPWITHMVYTSDGEKTVMQQLDGWLTAYGQSINDWLQNLINNLEVSTNVVQFFKTYTVPEGETATSFDLPATVVGSTGQYKYNAGDVFNVYYNGLQMIYGTDYEIVDGILSLKKPVLKGDNELNVHILKSQIGIPSYVDGDLEEY